MPKNFFQNFNILKNARLRVEARPPGTATVLQKTGEFLGFTVITGGAHEFLTGRFDNDCINKIATATSALDIAANNAAYASVGYQEARTQLFSALNSKLPEWNQISYESFKSMTREELLNRYALVESDVSKVNVLKDRVVSTWVGHTQESSHLFTANQLLSSEIARKHRGFYGNLLYNPSQK